MMTAVRMDAKLLTKLCTRHFISFSATSVLLCGVHDMLQTPDMYLSVAAGLYISFVALYLNARLLELSRARTLFEMIERNPHRLYTDYRCRDVLVMLSKLKAHADVLAVLEERFDTMAFFEVETKVTWVERLKYTLVPAVSRV